MSSDKQQQRVRETRARTTLVPSEVVDEASQRAFAVSVFVLIQAWKVFDLITLKVGESGRSNFSFVLKYALLDGTYVWTLLALNITGLAFGPFRALVYSLLLLVISLVAISDAVMPLGNTALVSMARLLRSQKELTIAGERIVPERVIDMDSHFKGRYTIHYLPDASAKMNPFKYSQLCLDSSTSDAVLHMPIEFNTTSPIGSLQIQRTTPDNKVVLLNFTKADIAKFLRKDYTHLRKYPGFKSNDERIFYLEYPITAPGTYTIKSVLDNNGINIRTYKSVFQVANCPKVEFVPIPNFDINSNYRCLDDAIAQPLSLPLVKVHAVFPAVIKYVTKLNGKPYHTFETKVESETDNVLVNSYTRNFLEQELYRHPEILAKAEPGVIEFHLSEIVDGLGVVRRFNTALKDPSVWHKLFLKGSIQLKLVDRSPQQDLVVNGEKTLFIESLHIEDSEFPISVTIQHDGKGSDILLHNITRIFKSRDDLARGFNVNSEGKYNIITALSKYCACKFSKNQFVSLVLAPEPLVQVKASPVTDDCIGTIGFNFAFEFTGKPPFQIDYQVSRNVSGSLSPVYDSTGSTVRHIKTAFKSYKFEYKPDTEGNFVIKFKQLKDMNYFTHPVSLEGKVDTYETYFKKKSEVSFYKSGHKQQLISACYGTSVQIPLYFTGNGPFSFTYSLVDTQTGDRLIKSQHVSEITNEYIINTPKLTKHARYRVEISKPLDKSSCGVFMHSSESMVIESRGEIPKAHIAEDLKTVKIVEGDSYRIPLNFETSVGRKSSDVLTYKHVDALNASNVVIGQVKSSDALLVKKEGTYSLESYENGGCPGEIGYQERKITIEFYEKPSISVTAKDVISTATSDLIELRKICQGGSKSATLKFTGSPPFIIDYVVKLPNGKIETGSMTSNSESMDIQLPTDKFGTYEHTFTGIFDSHYTKHKHSANGKTTSIRYEVRPSPVGRFEESLQYFSACKADFKRSKFMLPVNFVYGDAPFTATFSLMPVNAPVREITISGIQDGLVDFDEYVQDLDEGEHKIVLTKLVDAHGCSAAQNSNYFISIAPTPDVEKAEARTDYCVGEHILYNLIGEGPFKVYYLFRGVSREAEVFLSFRRLAAKPGTLEIKGISSHSCFVNFTDTPKQDSLKLQVHERPSVEINQGDNIVENIHEGDQVEVKFTFEGTPPFRMKYVRIVDVPGKGHKSSVAAVVETKEVADIWEHEHIELLSQEGTYEVIEVYDAYCYAVRSKSAE